MEIAVVGGGIVGLSAAFELAKESAYSVTVYEKNAELGGGVTPRAAGGFRSLYSTPTQVELSLVSNEFWRTLEDEYDVDVDLRITGYGFFTRERTTAEHVRGDVHMQQNLGVDSEYLTSDEMADRFPGVSSTGFRSGSFCGSDGVVDPRLALSAYAQLAREEGVDIRFDAEVTGLRHKDGLSGSNRITGIELEDEVINADYVVNAAGAWGSRIAEMAGVSIPISPKRRNGLLVEPEEPIPDDWPFLIDLDTGLWMRPSPSSEPDGTVFIGGEFGLEDPTRDPDDPELLANSVTTGWADKALDCAAKTADQIGENPKIHRGWTGMYAITPSNHPIIEESLPGLVNAVGHSGRGFMQSPAIGKLVRDIVTDDYRTPINTNVLKTDGLVDKRGSLPIPYKADQE
jgi:sarcosine oxidase subunit beta